MSARGRHGPVISGPWLQGRGKQAHIYLHGDYTNASRKEFWISTHLTRPICTWGWPLLGKSDHFISVSHWFCGSWPPLSICHRASKQKRSSGLGATRVRHCFPRPRCKVSKKERTWQPSLKRWPENLQQGEMGEVLERAGPDAKNKQWSFTSISDTQEGAPGM